MSRRRTIITVSLVAAIDRFVCTKVSVILLQILPYGSLGLTKPTLNGSKATFNGSITCTKKEMKKKTMGPGTPSYLKQWVQNHVEWVPDPEFGGN